MEGIEFDAFEQYLRESLPHLYDFMSLQAHPLLRLLVPHASGEASRVQVFREIVHEAIEQLRSPASSELRPRNARLYNILTLRYVKQQPIQYVLHQLNLSERQFYRDHTKAVQALSRILWDRVRTVEPVSENTISIQSEIQHIQNQSEPEEIDACRFLEKTLAAIRGLIDQHGARFELRVTERQMPPGADPMVLRQTLIWILSQLIVQFPDRSRFSLAYETKDQVHQFTFRHEGKFVVAQELAVSIAQHETLTSLAQALGARIVEPSLSERHFVLKLEIPSNQHLLLIVDDNPDAVALFCRYLSCQPFQLLTAYDGSQAIRTTRQFLPELIILDVMLPKQDGWEILQHLKDCPETRSIPVLICSVLDVSELALSLGADGFLRKPPGESAFLNALAGFFSQN